MPLSLNENHEQVICLCACVWLFVDVHIIVGEFVIEITPSEDSLEPSMSPFWTESDDSTSDEFVRTSTHTYTHTHMNTNKHKNTHTHTTHAQHTAHKHTPYAIHTTQHNTRITHHTSHHTTTHIPHTRPHTHTNKLRYSNWPDCSRIT